MFRRKTLLFVVSACVLGTGLALVSGCSKAVGSVTGKVTYNGKPLKSGTISFYTSDKSYNRGAAIMEDGTYNLPDIFAGEYNVAVETESARPKNMAAMGGSGNKKAPVRDWESISHAASNLAAWRI